VRASFDLSLRMLPDDASRAFCLLGLLGPQTVPGWVVDPLLDRSGADDVVDALIDANLLQLVDTDSLRAAQVPAARPAARLRRGGGGRAAAAGAARGRH
jgi:hypothetical protein